MSRTQMCTSLSHRDFERSRPTTDAGLYNRDAVSRDAAIGRQSGGRFEAGAVVMISTKTRVTAGVTCLIGGSVFQLVQYLVSPMKEADNAGEQVTAALAHPTAMSWAQVLDVPLLLLIPAVLFAGGVAGFGRTRLATAGTVIAFVSVLGAGYLLAQDVVVAAAAHATDHVAATSFVKAFEHGTAVNIVLAIYLIGHLVGFVLLGVALMRSGRVPVWAGVAMCLWPIGELLGEASGVSAVAAIGFALLVVAFGACAVALPRGTSSTPVPQYETVAAA
jgi:hypothetical protein